MSLKFLLKCVQFQRTFLEINKRLPSFAYSSTTAAIKSAESSDVTNFHNEKLQKYLETLREEFYKLRVQPTNDVQIHQRIGKLNKIVHNLEQYRAIKSNMVSAEDMAKEKDDDMLSLMKEENEVYSDLLKKAEAQIMIELLNFTDSDTCGSIIFEVNAGAGGQEAMLFANDLYEMYINYLENNGWDYDVLDHVTTDIGGLRNANVIINSREAFNNLRFEAGVHRVQRIPATEKAGRIHTSTVSVTVIPRPDDKEIQISEKDLKIETKRASGAGGQHVNTTDSAVRIVHLPTGLSVESQTERSQLKNREIGLKRLQAILIKRQYESTLATTQATRRAQQGNLNRNEKIRTYNFVQDRVTDHRISNGTTHNLREFLQGGEQLNEFISRIAIDHRKYVLAEVLTNWQEPKEKNSS
ncbi:peptide chain release factor 1 [Teleopsis dalmanni]|uniref:peptide chain release factor 1 n=1 Tax=Teleopsis dalmanni TaxID=139649 RepID=UPI0018CE99DD|nr:peptide chain release factor 1 [Teleopsis dalmanni]